MCRLITASFWPPMLERRSDQCSPALTANAPLRMKAAPVTISRCCSTFLSHVGHVVSLSAEPQMPKARARDAVDDVDTGVIVPTAEADIAGVKNGHLVRDWLTARDFVGKPVSGNDESTIQFSAEDLSVASSAIEATGPGPAGAESRDALGILVKESRDQSVRRRNPNVQATAPIRAELNCCLARFASGPEEGSTTDGACTGNLPSAVPLEITGSATEPIRMIGLGIKRPSANLAEGTEQGTIGLHLDPPDRGATPRAVSAAPRLRVA